MVIPEFISAVILTILGVIIAEFIIHYLKEKSLRDKILTSLLIEIDTNIDNAKFNRDLEEYNIKNGYDFSPIPFKLSSYHRIMHYMDSKLYKIIISDEEDNLINAYNTMEEFNMMITEKNFKIAGDIEPTLGNVVNVLEKFNDIRKIKSYKKKIINKKCYLKF